MPKGSFKIDLSDLHYKVNKFVKTLDDPSGVFTKTMSDMRSRAPGKIADAIRTQYSIKKAEVMPNKTSREKRGAVSIRIEGETIEALVFHYKGRTLTPLHFGMKPTQRPDKKNYKISAKIKKAREVFEKKPGYSLPFIAKAQGGKMLAFQREEGSVGKNGREKIDARRTVAIPEMVDNPDVREFIDNDLGDLLEKRFNYHMDRFLDKAVK